MVVDSRLSGKLFIKLFTFSGLRFQGCVLRVMLVDFVVVAYIAGHCIGWVMREVKIDQAPVALYKILKFEGIVSSGGEAKSVIADGLVQVNDVVETQKRKQIVAGDTIEFAGEKILII